MFFRKDRLYSHGFEALGAKSPALLGRPGSSVAMGRALQVLAQGPRFHGQDNGESVRRRVVQHNVHSGLGPPAVALQTSRPLGEEVSARR